MTALVSHVDAPAVAVEPARLSRLAWLRERGMGATILVSAISTAFGVVLLSATGYIAAVFAANPLYGSSDTLTLILGILSGVLLSVAVYVAAIVTANTFSTIIAGRTRRIALLRLIGATARSQRSEVAGQGFVVGAVGAVAGLVLTVLAVVLAIPLLDRVLGVASGYAAVQPVLVVPAIAVVLTTWLAAWAGSRRVLTVTPLEALGGSVERSRDEIAERRGRRVVAIVLGVIGVMLLGGGLLLGALSPIGVVVAFFGGLCSFTAVSLSAVSIMPPLLKATGRLFGRSVTARLAAENAVRYPERSSRMAIGVVMGVALVVMFAVAAESVKALVSASGGGVPDPAFDQMIDTFSTVMMSLVAVSAVIAAVGLVNLLTIGVVQRRRELGLLRALGLTSAQIRRMVLIEAAHVTITALLFGLTLGVLYGWVAAQSLLGSVAMPPSWTAPTFVAPAVPWLPVVVVVLATAALTLAAAVAPTRIATRTAPVEALAE
ncbi:ABC transporter permease [Microbacterium sp. EYE_5]|uniref:ABC transporter permease n=1 Tax=unclassified Microbacterium TaxID=2609290 RepID=UPI0020065F5B|nr:MULTISPECIES: ABC transporter permease [unclassified Microbacterium]MCK6079930.1 ABC transporter permease [Microbacterium sp. EYE_382]MCK6085201.1 ABC transporter permease [Microbacterium sp. EYE_384]MCK6122573.1 ABC transporter permease [Microbacterium sp. EYE_80]MCK6125964.1 ABC transporter permease [Microbacterium sp. EYE_79]MCK6140885.1 ABC transporter permease [Microbacterium sp. EYE_39]